MSGRSLPAALMALALLVSSCGGEQKHRPVLDRESPESHLKQIGTLWVEDATDDGLLENDPNGIASFHVHTRVEVKLTGGKTAHEKIVRDEAFRLKGGDRFECKVSGDFDVNVAYAWEGTEVRLWLANPEVRIPRVCAKSGFPVAQKILGAAETIYALRSDQLVAISPPRSRSVLLPIQ